MIITVALNPGIEKRIGIKELTVGAETDVDSYRLSIGRSSVYSAYIMKLLQGDPYVLGFAGGIGGRYIKNFLDRNRIKSSLISKDQELESVFILEIPGQPDTVLTDHSHLLDDADARNFKHQLIGHINDGTIILLNGDTYDSTSVGIMEDTMTLARKEGKRVVLSIEGEHIESFISKAPYAWIVDDEQLKILGIEGDDDTKIRAMHSFVREHGIHYAFYPVPTGVIGVSRNKICIGSYEGLEIDQASWMKEAMAGGIAMGIKRKYGFERMVKMATAIGVAIHSEDYPDICTRKEIDSRMKKSRIFEYYSKGNYHSLKDNNL